MNLFSYILIISETFAQNQPCMDYCGLIVDECHRECNKYEEENDPCHATCYYTMCRCFSGCGCPECCQYINTSEDMFKSDKIDVSQFLKKRTIFK